MLDHKEHWALKNQCFWLWCWRRLLRVPWTARRSNQHILKDISTEYSLEGPMVKLKLQYLATWCEELTHWKRPWWWERLEAGGELDDRGWDGWMALLTQWTWVWAGSGSWWWTEKPNVLQSMGSQRFRLSYWTEPSLYKGFPGGTSGKDHACQCRRQKRPGFNLLCMHGVCVRLRNIDISLPKWLFHLAILIYMVGLPW